MDNIQAFSQRFCSLFKEQNYKSISAFLREYNERYPYESFTHKVFLQYQNAEATPSIDRLHNLCDMWNVSSDYLLGLSEKKEYKDIQFISEAIGLSELSIKNIHDFCALENKNPLDIILSSELAYSFLEDLADFFKKRNYFSEEFTTKDNDKILIDLTDYRTIKLSAITNTLENIEMIVNNSYSVMNDFYQKKIEELKEGEQNGGNKKKKE